MVTTYGYHVWLPRMVTTYGYHVWLPRMVTTYGYHVWLPRMVTTYGYEKIKLVTRMVTTYGYHVWLRENKVGTYVDNKLCHIVKKSKEKLLTHLYISDDKKPDGSIATTIHFLIFLRKICVTCYFAVVLYIP